MRKTIFIYVVHPMGHNGKWVSVKCGSSAYDAERSPTMTIEIDVHVFDSAEVCDAIGARTVRTGEQGPVYEVDTALFNKAMSKCIVDRAVNRITRHRDNGRTARRSY